LDFSVRTVLNREGGGNNYPVTNPAHRGKIRTLAGYNGIETHAAVYWTHKRTIIKKKGETYEKDMNLTLIKT